MSDQILPEKHNHLIYRGIRDEADIPLLLEINLSSRQADGDDTPVTLADLTQAFAPSADLNPARDVLIAFLASAPETAVGYTRIGWYSSRPDNCLYYQYSRLKQAFRGQGLWEKIIHAGEQRMREVAREQAPVAERWFQGWSSDNQAEWTAVLLNTGYQVVRRFNNMLLKLDNPPQIPLPPGFEVRPVQPEHMHAIWQAQKEMNEGLFENVAEDWLEEKYPAWFENSEHTPQFWQVAWDGDQLAGMVLARYNAEEYEHKSPRHGHTEHVFVRPAWRKRGLASALIARSLQAQKAAGVEEVELGVDAENETAAFKLYQSLGYKTFSVDTWFRKPMD